MTPASPATHEPAPDEQPTEAAQVRIKLKPARATTKKPLPARDAAPPPSCPSTRGERHLGYR